MFDLIIVGAGPAGLGVAIEAQKRGLKYAILEKGCVVNSIYRFPADMTFFSTPENLQIGDLVFVSDLFRPNRIQTLKYYLSVARHYDLQIIQGRRVTDIKKTGDSFAVTAEWMEGEESYEAKKVVLATGYYDNPNMLGIPGEELPKVSHYYTEPHPGWNRDVVIIGGRNSAVEAALAFYRSGARVTIVHRGEKLSDSVKYWVRPDTEKRLESGQINGVFNSEVTAIEPDTLTITNNKSGKETKIKNDMVFALTGYHPDLDLLEKIGVEVNGEDLTPKFDSLNMETNIPGLHLAGSVSAGRQCNKIFIENSRDHGRIILGS